MADLDAAPDQLLDPADVLLQLKDVAAARATVPDLPEYGFLGSPGDPLWLAPEVQDQTLLWPGWNTESLPAGVFTDDAVRLHLRDVQGPGRLEVFMTGERWVGARPGRRDRSQLDYGPNEGG